MVRAVVDNELSKSAAAHRFNATPKTVGKWVERFRKEGLEGLRDRSSRPHSSPNQTPQATCETVEALRRQRYTGEQIAKQLAIAPATVSRILRRLGLNKLNALEPAEPVRRYERERPGELIHIDIKKLGKFNRIGHRITGDRAGQSNSRGVGWEYVHVCIDDHSRIGFADIMPDQKKRSAVAFLKAAVAYYAGLGVKVERVMTDNGSCYKSFAWRDALTAAGITHQRIRPYRPQTNGKVERFNRTLLEEWAYAHPYTSEIQRRGAFDTWLHIYNHHRGHTALKRLPPASRVPNLSGQNT
jgi:transposase InsO family protein